MTRLIELLSGVEMGEETTSCVQKENRVYDPQTSLPRLPASSSAPCPRTQDLLTNGARVLKNPFNVAKRFHRVVESPRNQRKYILVPFTL